MKNVLIVLFFGTLFLQPVIGQNNFYDFTLYAGMSPKQTPVHAGLLMNREDPMNEFVFNLEEIGKSYTFGFRKNFRFSRPFYGTLGLEYSRQTQLYSLNFLNPELPEGNEPGLKVTCQVITMPAGVGVKFNRFDVTSGLQFHYTIGSEIQEEQPMGIKAQKPGLQMGWFSGIGFSFDRTRIGIQYQSSLDRYGDNLTYKQKPMGLMNVPGNVSFTIGFSF